MRSNLTPPRKHARVVPCLALGDVSLFLIPCSLSLAQTITPSGLNTAVSAPIALPSGQTQFNITGGTRPGGGANLFHSFGTFNVPNNNIANFFNDAALPTSNILGRVTGGNISNIFGTLQTTGFGNANLFLMNPAGFLFGPNATLNVGGMVAFTSADYLRLTDGARFNVIPNAAADALLSAAPVAAFGFLGSNPGAISVQGTQLTVTDGTGISLVGGNITVEGGTLTAPHGQINLVSVDNPSKPKVGGEVVIPASGQDSGFTPTGFRTLGTISLSQGNTISVVNLSEAEVGGRVVIRGGQLIMDAVTIDAGAVRNAGSITLESKGGLDIRNSTLSAVADINAGTVDLKAGESIDLTSTNVSASVPTSNAGSITMAAPIISLRSSTLGAGASESNPGMISLSATRSVSLTNGTVLSADGGHSGEAGIILINGGKLFTAQQSIITAISGLSFGGTIQVQADRIGLTDSQLMANGGQDGGGTIQLQANRIGLTDSQLTANGFDGGHITLDAKKTTLTDSQIFSTSTDGQGGTITINSNGFHQDASSVIDASSLFGTDGTVTINGVIQP